MTKRYIKEAELMQKEVEDLRVRVNRFDDGNVDFNITAEIDKVKRELHLSKDSKTASINAGKRQPSK